VILIEWGPSLPILPSRECTRATSENRLLRRVFVYYERDVIGGLRTWPIVEILRFDPVSIITRIWNYKVEEDEVGGTCGTNGGEEERV
jgi:hypothetical protein